VTERAVTISRVSSVEQADPSKPSLEQQAAAGRLYADAAGWAIVEELTEPGISGNAKLTNRPAIQRLLELARNGEVEHVIWLKWDRASRSALKALTLFEELDGLGVGVHSTKEDIDASTKEGRLFRNTLLNFAEYERETITERNVMGRHGKAARGGWSGGRPPYGYRSTPDGRLVIDEDEAKAVRRAYALYVTEGLSAQQVAKTLNAEGYRPRPVTDRKTGLEVARRWSHQALIGARKRIGKRPEKGPDTRERYYSPGLLTRPIYGGEGITKHHGGQVFTIEAPAIVAPEVAEAARARYFAEQGAREQYNVDASGELKPRGSRYGLAGRVFHVHGNELVVMHGTTRKGVRRYVCSAGDECPGFGERHGETIKSLEARKVEAAVLGRPVTGLGASGGLLTLLIDQDYRQRIIAANDAELLAIEDGDLQGAEDNVATLEAAGADAWQAAFLAATRFGASHDEAETRADEAVGELQAQLHAAKVARNRLRDKVRLAEAATVAFRELETMAVQAHPGSPDEDGDTPETVAEVVKALTAEVVRVARGIKDGNRAADFAPWAVEWLRSIATRLDATVTIDGGEPTAWTLKLEGVDVGTTRNGASIAGATEPQLPSSTKGRRGLSGNPEGRPRPLSSLRSSPTGSP